MRRAREVHERPRARRDAFPGRIAPRVEETEALEETCARSWRSWRNAREGTGPRMGEARNRQAARNSTPHDQTLAHFEEQARDTSLRSRKAATAAKPSRSATARGQGQTRIARRFQTTVLSTEDDARRASSAAGHRGRRAGAAADVREPARVRRKLAGDRLEVEAGFMKMQVSIDDVIEVLPETASARAASCLRV